MKYLRALVAVLLCVSTAAASAYPTKPIKVVLGFAPGGGSDILLRSILPGIEQALGGQVVVDYKPGAGGNIAMEAVAKAEPDGYTLLMGTPGLATNPCLYANLSFDPLRDFAPISQVGSVQSVLLVHPSLPVDSVSGLIRYAREKKGGLNYASPGAGTSLHLAAELFKSITGIEMVHVPYKGGGQAMNDLIGGQVQVMFNVLPSAAPQIVAGKVKPLAVTSTTRAARFPEVPTMVEAGVASYSAVTWNGIVAPKGTPGPIIEQLNRAIRASLDSPQTRERLEKIGQDPAPSTPDEFGALIKSENAKWCKVIDSIGLKAN
ncbi:MAG: Bug family tripartite tricarboxylate transporter substrate binding protein [Lautropia sp.]